MDGAVAPISIQCGSCVCVPKASTKNTKLHIRRVSRAAGPSVLSLSRSSELCFRIIFNRYFLGSSSGVCAGVWCSYNRFHSPEGIARTHAARGSLFSTSGILWSARRFVVGIVIVLIAREITNRLAKLFVPWVARVTGVMSSDHDAITYQINKQHAEAKKTDTPVDTDDLPKIIGYNSNTGVRVLTYTAVGWSVSQLCPHVFELLGI